MLRKREAVTNQINLWHEIMQHKSVLYSQNWFPLTSCRALASLHPPYLLCNEAHPMPIIKYLYNTGGKYKQLPKISIHVTFYLHINIAFFLHLTLPELWLRRWGPFVWWASVHWRWLSICSQRRHAQYNSYDFGMSPLEVVNELTDQPKQLLRVLIRRFSEFDLDKREKNRMSSRTSRTSNVIKYNLQLTTAFVFMSELVHGSCILFLTKMWLPHIPCQHAAHTMSYTIKQTCTAELFPPFRSLA